MRTHKSSLPFSENVLTSHCSNFMGLESRNTRGGGSRQWDLRLKDLEAECKVPPELWITGMRDHRNKAGLGGAGVG